MPTPPESAGGTLQGPRPRPHLAKVQTHGAHHRVRAPRAVLDHQHRDERRGSPAGERSARQSRSSGRHSAAARRATAYSTAAPAPLPGRRDSTADRSLAVPRGACPVRYNASSVHAHGATIRMPQPARPIRPVPCASFDPGPERASAAPGSRWASCGWPGRTPVAATDDGGRTLDALAAALGEALVGSRGMALLGPRFPLIVKLIDAGDWLSLQVHPDDALARELYGPDAVGKTEAWLVIDADPAGELVTGPPTTSMRPRCARPSPRGRASHQHCHRRRAVAGDTLLIRAGNAPRDRPGRIRVRDRAAVRPHLPHLRLGAADGRDPPRCGGAARAPAGAPC